MAYAPLSDDEQTEPDNPNKLSPNGQMIAIGVYGFLVLVGFFFGIVTGYERPRPEPQAKAPREHEPRAETPKPQPTPRLVPNTTLPPKEEPRPEPMREDPKPEPKTVEPPKPEPKMAATPTSKPEPKAVEPKPEPKKEPEPAVAISFEKQVRPILMQYCGDCHGNTGRPRGDVDLRSLAVITDPKNPPILVPGNPDKSALYTRIANMSMPPDGKPGPGKGQTQLIREWIAGGAKPRRRKLRRPG